MARTPRHRARLFARGRRTRGRRCSRPRSDAASVRETVHSSHRCFACRQRACNGGTHCFTTRERLQTLEIYRFSFFIRIAYSVAYCFVYFVGCFEGFRWFSTVSERSSSAYSSGDGLAAPGRPRGFPRGLRRAGPRRAAGAVAGRRSRSLRKRKAVSPLGPSIQRSVNRTVSSTERRHRPTERRRVRRTNRVAARAGRTRPGAPRASAVSPPGQRGAVVSTVVSSEKSIYNRNSSRSLAARYAERIHTPARAHNGFVRSVFERKLTDGRSGLTARSTARRAWGVAQSGELSRAAVRGDEWTRIRRLPLL